MKLNKVVLILAVAGILPDFAAHAAPVEAMASLNVKASVAIQHQLTAATDITSGKLAENAVVATGLVTSNLPLNKVSLAWNRSVNAIWPGKTSDYAALHMTGGTGSQGDFPVKLLVGTSVSNKQSNDSGTVYTLATPGTQFDYQVVNAASEFGDVDFILRAGDYKMSVQADVVES
ncbi:hypothetical protein RBC57_004598 [Salmonella enterica]|uniref:Fimbrial protein n=1 Tax=Salmonella enterica TaxID=28901 RepID=A0A628V8Z8_SALER|nr:hypothetical protein [Salmonella enterica]EEC6702093.1 hypothetical protein [Salmonella enterica]ELF5202351.1 hypothetical protein [Salmonella enterica]